MLHAGLDLSRKKLESVCSPSGESISTSSSSRPTSIRSAARPPDRRGPRRAGLGRRRVMTGARLVHDTLEAEGWSVQIADAQKVKGLAPLACKTDEIDSLVLATLSERDLCRRSGRRTDGQRGARARPLSPPPGQAQDRAQEPRPLDPDRVRARLPVTDLFGVEGRQLLERLEVPEPWRGNVGESVMLIHELERQIDQINRRLGPSAPTIPTSRCC